ncbi:unnamed protein product [Linum tenue]|uniref:Uncharacterized protein n=1 Tax=Linum tenue TaxID=586396 RepID=A0AAV0LGA8_9ROSI|nr:unnamed protein product [Linum tenue]
MLNSISQRLQGKVALITGGASGIGAATARLFAKHGAKVLVADISRSETSVADDHPAISYVHCDVSKESDVREAVDAAVSMHGKLDVMFSNAGVVGRNNLRMDIAALERDDLERVFAVNVYGAFYAAKHAARVMIPRNQGGAILFTASYVTGALGESGHPYAASKHATVGLMKNLTVELGQHGIRVNALSPYGIPTPLSMGATGVTDPKLIEAGVTAKVGLGGAVLEANDVAEAALYLASEESKFISGLNIMVDGGQHLKSA